MAETKIIYHIDEEETPYLVKLPVPPEKVTLADFKNVLSNRPVHHYKFFFKSMDQDFGVVKEEISDDNAKLPCFNGRVVSWLVLAESSHSDGGSQSTESRTDLPLPIERTGGIGDSRPPSFHPNASSSRDGLDNETGTDSVVSHRRDRHRRKNRETHDDVPRINGHPKLDRIRDPGGYDSASTVMSSELESSSFVDSDEDENTSRLSSSTEQSTSSRLIRKHKRRRRKQKMRQIDRSSSFSSITDSTMSLNIITVTLNMEKYNFLGISIVGQSNDRGDGGIYIGSIMKGGAVAADGRIEPGDMLLQVNDVNFENMSNDDAVRVLREIVSKPGPISLTVAKCWDPTPRSYFTIPRAEPVRPIDPAAWITHTSALTGAYPRYGMSPSMSIITCTSSSLTSSKPESEKQEDSPLSVKSDMATIVKVMQLPDSGLEIRDRMWLKITISNAVIGADVVDWLYTHVEGFKERREARKYASSMLKHGYLRHTVNKITFSEQCYYVFGDLCGNVAALNLNEGSSGTSDQDTLAPLPHPAAPWPLGQGYSYQYPLAPPCFPPTYQEPGFSYGSGSAGSQHSEGSKSSGSSRSNREGKRSSGREKDRRSTGSGSGSDRAPRSGGSKNERPLSQHSHHSHSSVSRSQRSHRSSHHSHGPPGLPPLFSLPKIGNKVYGTSGPPGGPPVRELANVPPELTGSRQSFQKAMGNPCEFFVDIM
ncbi:segment polarity protein dishevelled homolog DVL-1 isoform X5 [Xenopus tropicalis]|uniref:Dishevelled segment polarity protein 1 n=1 Tax=Xenopus tropicalis TaxID=8364 RepID=A0A6I8RBY1_XENTR|nr:segment polarity protein dishevelled homolog DVL-1 isoform X5 [Xenopus tropicalis]|eukprot:XP_012821476.1 PREDICTED: segment polarity protein dishevelled homolog DVL-1 isoform X5 [Xenopus tropicalis]